MKMFVGVTDYNWYSSLKEQDCDEANFWRPGGQYNFRALLPGDLFLFKLRYPYNCIAGGGFFVRYSILPAFLAWEIFGVKNGIHSLEGLETHVTKIKNRLGVHDNDLNIGCIILNKPFFFDESDWIPTPGDWDPAIGQGKTYDSDTEIGSHLYKQIVDRLEEKYSMTGDKGLSPAKSVSSIGSEVDGLPKGNRPFNWERVADQPLGSGTFRVIVTEAYDRRCAITGEGTLPVLNAAQIKPYNQDGPRIVPNGILLRTDLHTLYNRGYITITEYLRVEVSNKLKTDFGDGRIYYPYHGQQLVNIPKNMLDIPARKFLQWHNGNVYLG